MLLDKYLPKYTYKEYHDIQVSCSKKYAYTAARNLDFSNSKTIKFLFTIRGLPTNDMTLEGFSNQVKFTFLEEIQNEEFIIGFWAKVGVEKILDKEQFAIDNKSRRLKVVWNFKINRIEDELVVVSTETRVYCIAMITKLFFAIYWPIIRPFSGLIRKKMLNIIKENAEHSFNSRALKDHLIPSGT
jgi:hypothetical protein